MFHKVSYLLITFLSFFLYSSNARLSNDDTHEYEGEPQVLILFIISGLALGGLVTHILSRLPVPLPYTVVVFLLGIIISLFAQNFEGQDMGHSTRKWIDLNPELMLYLFLPVLIFGEAMSLKW
jgi:Na+/glutamate symporter